MPFYANLLDKEMATYEISAALDFMGTKYSNRVMTKFLNQAIREPLNRIGSKNVQLPKKTNMLWHELLQKHSSQFF